MRHHKLPARIVCWCLLPFFSHLVGCARPPWGTIIEGDRADAVKMNYLHFLDKVQMCSTGIDGEALLSWHSTLEDGSFSGYFQVMRPSSLKFTVFNPLGQPLYAVASNGLSFQSINTVNRSFLAGSLRSYGIRHHIPPTFLAGQWGDWITGHASSSTPHILEMSNDNESRGVWFAVSDEAEGRYPRERLLLETSQQRLVERILVDREGKTQATIAYEKWQDLDGCDQPLSISVTGLSFGAEARLELSDIRRANLQPEDFSLPIPPNYRRQFRP